MLAPEVAQPPTRREHVSHSLSPFPAWAHGLQDTRYFSTEEKVVQFDVLGPELDDQGALSFGQAVMGPQDLLAQD